MRQKHSLKLSQMTGVSRFVMPRDATVNIGIIGKGGSSMKPFARYLLLGTVIALAGCNERALETVRKVTYPPDFNYVSKKNLQGTMDQFAWYTELLQRNLDNTEITPEQRLQTVQILNRMEDLAYRLGSQSLSSNHRQVTENIDAFRRDIIEARNGLLKNPPDYNKARIVPSYCLRCHALGREK